MYNVMLACLCETIIVRARLACAVLHSVNVKKRKNVLRACDKLASVTARLPSLVLDCTFKLSALLSSAQTAVSQRLTLSQYGGSPDARSASGSASSRARSARLFCRTGRLQSCFARPVAERTKVEHDQHLQRAK